MNSIQSGLRPGPNGPQGSSEFICEGQMYWFVEAAIRHEQDCQQYYMGRELVTERPHPQDIRTYVDLCVPDSRAADLRVGQELHFVTGSVEPPEIFYIERITRKKNPQTGNTEACLTLIGSGMTVTRETQNAEACRFRRIMGYQEATHTLVLAAEHYHNSILDCEVYAFSCPICGVSDQATRLGEIVCACGVKIWIGLEDPVEERNLTKVQSC